MVFMCDRRAEQRENAIAGRLHDVTVVAMRRVNHQLQRRIDDRAGLLRVEVAHKLGRALDVGEQRRHRLALALDCFGRCAISGDYDLRFRRENDRGGGGLCGANCSPAFPAKSRPQDSPMLCTPGKINSSFAPHPSQNEASPGLSWLQDGQRIGSPA
jgi:hypothetical protein